MKDPDDYYMSIGDVAGKFGLSTSRIRQRDHEFEPRRESGSGWRRYSVERVTQLLARRAQQGQP